MFFRLRMAEPYIAYDPQKQQTKIPFLQLAERDFASDENKIYFTASLRAFAARNFGTFIAAT